MTQDDAARKAAEVLDALTVIDEQAGELMITCPRCKGTGIGQTGPDPDWCGECGGPGQVYDQEEDIRRRVAVIVTALLAARREGYEAALTDLRELRRYVIRRSAENEKRSRIPYGPEQQWFAAKEETYRLIGAKLDGLIGREEASPPGLTSHDLAELALPYEALLMDASSRKWIAPEIWAAVEAAVIKLRSLTGVIK